MEISSKTKLAVNRIVDDTNPRVCVCLCVCYFSRSAASPSRGEFAAARGKRGFADCPGREGRRGAKAGSASAVYGLKVGRPHATAECS